MVIEKYIVKHRDEKIGDEEKINNCNYVKTVNILNVDCKAQ